MHNRFPFHLEYRASCGRWVNASCGPYATAAEAQAQIDKPDFLGYREGWRVREHVGRYVYGGWAKEPTA